MNIVDAMTPVSVIDRAFIATNVEFETQFVENPDRALCRYEFYEVLIRIAAQKYIESAKILTSHA
jgi:hypothetical protein